MAVDVKKVNERWAKWSLGVFAGLLWIGHLWSACWFVTHHEVVQAEVLERHDHLFPGRRHGWDCLVVTYVDVDGKPAQRRIEWRATWAPKTRTIQLWRGTSGLIPIGPASYVEAFWVEAWALYLLGFITALIGGAIAYYRAKTWWLRGKKR
jgi:hypothetical protein